MANQSVNIPSIVNKPVNFQQNMPANITSMQGVDTEKIKQSVRGQQRRGQRRTCQAMCQKWWEYRAGNGGVG